MTQFLDLLLITWASWLNDHGPEMVKHNVVKDYEADSDPRQAKLRAKSGFHQWADNIDKCVKMETY